MFVFVVVVGVFTRPILLFFLMLSITRILTHAGMHSLPEITCKKNIFQGVLFSEVVFFNNRTKNFCQCNFCQISLRTNVNS